MKESFAERLRRFNRQTTADTLCLQNVRLGDKYLIFDMIAVGSHSIIYYGIEEASKLERVFKCYNLKEIENTKGFQEKQLCKRLSNCEYTLMKNCDSIHMLQFYDVYEDKDCKIVVSEYCNMGSLRAQIDQREGKGTDELRAIAILKQIVTALKNVHRNCNFLHKNLKSKNILIQDGIYKLIDLGLPLKIGSPSLHKQDEDFLIPEIIMKKAYDQKAEVWNVGVLFHEILFGHIPQALAYNSRNYLISSAVATILSQDMENYDRMTKQFLEDCLRTNPEERMTWAQLEDHMIFELIAPPIPRPIEEKVEDEQDSRLSAIIFISEDNDGPRCVVEPETQAFYNSKFNLEVQQKLLDKQLQQPYQKLGQYMDIQQLDPVSWLPLRKNINKNQHKLYLLLKDYYLQCLKVEFVYKDIFVVLKTLPKLKEERDLVQFMYLLISRCFTEMSQLNVIVKKESFQSKSQSVLIACIKRQTKCLYDDVRRDWQQFSDCLYELENKWVNILKDKVNSIIHTVEYKKKDAILSGIEGTDYERSDQIDLTVRLYLQAIRQQLLKLMAERRNLIKEEGALKYMERYQEMWNMTVLPDSCLNVKQYIQLICKIQSKGDL